MALVLNQSITEMISRNLFGCKGWLGHKADILTAICEPITYKIWKPHQLTKLMGLNSLITLHVFLYFQNTLYLALGEEGV
jgi:hypothetical protein